ncbi:hypothetical protein PSHT_00346 [Puccinia striiformis]|nr:hypothetical protein PSHT_00346 [Puccinia striiformis]
MSSYRVIEDHHHQHHQTEGKRSSESNSNSSESTRLDDEEHQTKYPPPTDHQNQVKPYRPTAWKRIFWDTTPIEQRILNHQNGVGIQDRAYVCWLLSFGMFIALIMEFITNAKYQGTPIAIKPTFNFMIGPSAEVLINTGARFTPCIKNVPALSNIPFPCLNSTSSLNTCSQSLESVCGFGGFDVPGQPDQKFRFVMKLILLSLYCFFVDICILSRKQIHLSTKTDEKQPQQVLPLFLHAGLIHYLLNIAVQLTSSALIERQMGSLRFILLYIPSGIFGFILGGNFSLVGQPSVGASGAIFSTYAAVMVDLISHWNIEYRPTRKLVFLVFEIVAGLLLGLIPGIDNFSHIGGFSMGILLAILLFPVLHQTSVHRFGFYTVRVISLIGVILMFILLYRNFFTEDPAASCNWCRYLSCWPTASNNRCKGTGLQVTETTTTTTSPTSQPSVTRTTSSAIMLPALLRLIVSFYTSDQ